MKTIVLLAFCGFTSFSFSAQETHNCSVFDGTQVGNKRPFQIIVPVNENKKENLQDTRYELEISDYEGQLFINLNDVGGQKRIAATSSVGTYGSFTLMSPRLNVTCFTPHVTETATFHYDSVNGKCTNTVGEAGLNYISLDDLKRTGNGECTDLRGLNLSAGTTSNEIFVNWNLRGADLTQAHLHFANIEKAQLQGANLSQFDFGYAEVIGEIDSHTKIPDENIIGLVTCTLIATKLVCNR